LLEPATMGDPMRPLLWVSKSHAKLAAALCLMGHQIAKMGLEALAPKPGTSRKAPENRVYRLGRPQLPHAVLPSASHSELVVFNANHVIRDPQERSVFFIWKARNQSGSTKLISTKTATIRIAPTLRR